MLVSAFYAVAIGIIYIIFYNITWQPTPLYYFLKTAELYASLVIPIGWFALVLIIIYLYWSRMAGYISEIAAASAILIQPDDEDIRLPGDLREIEIKMNQIKMN